MFGTVSLFVTQIIWCNKFINFPIFCNSIVSFLNLEVDELFITLRHEAIVNKLPGTALGCAANISWAIDKIKKQLLHS